MIEPGAPLVDRVDDEEHLHRSIWLRPECFGFDTDGNARVSPQAFSDRSRKASVFRRKLCENPPWSNPPRLGEDNAVIGLICRNVREIRLTHKSDLDKSPATYEIDVEPDVSDDHHIAHAVIFTNPEGKNSRPFEKLKERLAQVAEAEWDIAPNPEFIEQLRQTKMP